MNLSQTFRDFKRLNQIVNVLFKQELGFIVEKINLSHHLPFQSKIQKKKFEQPESIPVRLREAMEQLSGTFIKLGQLLSLRPDLIPKEYCEEFSKLQDNVKPFQYEEVKKIIEQEFNKPISKLFISFSKEPIAAASIGQVHKAILSNGKKVAVKVQRPNIEKIFETDMDLLYHIAHLLEKHIPEVREFQPRSIIQEFERYTKNELNYLVEGKNIESFYINFKHDKYIKIPNVYWKYTTKKVLTMDFMEGTKITEIKQFQKYHSSRKKIAENISGSFIKQVLCYGLFHADPHPGNLFIEAENKIALLDFGIVGRISSELREEVENLLIGLVKPDRELLANTVINLGFVAEDTNIEEFKDDLSTHLGEYHNTSLNQMDMSNFFYDALALARKYKIKFPTNFILLIKAMITIESLDKTLYPDLNFVELCKPEVDKILKKRTSSTYLVNSIKASFFEFKDSVQQLPRELRKALRTAGKIKLDIEDSDIRRFALEMNRSSNRLTTGIIISALILSSAVLTLTKVPPLIGDISLFAIISTAIAIVLSISLIFSIIKGGVIR